MDLLSGKITFNNPALTPPVTVTPVLFQAHGPKCRFFRHTQINTYTLSLIGQPYQANLLKAPFELQLFQRAGDVLTPIGPVIYSQSKKRALSLFCMAKSRIIEQIHDHNMERANTFLLD